jgi:hypothetical protein
MHVVMTKAGKNQFHSGMGIIREVDDSIEALNKNNDIKATLNELAVGANFKLWADKIIPNPGLNRCRYENFVIGYLCRHDMLPGEDDHSIYFKWDGDRVRVFMSPLSSPWVEPVSTEPAPVASVIDVAAANMTDPPPSTTPPPPLSKR